MPDLIVDASLETLMAEFSRSGVRELHVKTDEFELYLSNDAFAPMLSEKPGAAPIKLSPASAALPVMTAPIASAVNLPVDAVIVTAPNLGTFYRSPKPGAPVYVEVGSTVSTDTELCLVEVMKLFTSVTAGTAGRVHAVLATDGEMVESGQPLFAILRN
jgi:acetyl-CoA carboxylase biotin carboxyl carrier protein